MRATEVLFIAYFGYAACVAALLRIPRAAESWLVLAVVGGLILIARRYAHPFRFARDWIPFGLLLLAYRQMDWFTRPERRADLEFLWERWDRTLLISWRLQAAIEAAGPVIPGLLELCYLLIYAVGPVTVAALYLARRKELVDRALLLTLGGTLGSYCFFPFFPTAPPRAVFTAPAPHVVTTIRQLNLWIVNGAGIHASVFPSAHVSGAFSAAFAMILYLPKENKWKWEMLAYACAVAVATVYGRYHYAADAVAGIGVSLAALGLARWPLGS